jgi:hypothetical protein
MMVAPLSRNPMALLRLLVPFAAIVFGALAFRARLNEARRAAGPSAESIFVLGGSWQRALAVLTIAAVCLSLVRGVGIALALVWVVVTVPLFVGGLVRVVVVAHDGLVVGGRKHPWTGFAGVLEDAGRGRIVLFGMTPEATRIELEAPPPRRAALLAALRRQLPEIAG